MGRDRKLDKNRPFDSVAEVDGKDVYINDYFMDYINSTYPKEQVDELLKQLLLHLNEKMIMRKDVNHPFHGDEDGFDKYCRGKYKTLYDSIIGLIDSWQGRG
jgi:hypothetical protein